MRIKVTRAFCLAGLRQEVGAVLDLPEHQAREALLWNKAQIVTEPTPPAIVPVESGAKPAPTPRASRKEK